MENAFRKPIVVKVDKKSGFAHLSVKSSEYKVDVYKILISDMESFLNQFREGMRSADDIFTAEPEPSTNDDL
ncbi:MAG: hypothetical protein DRQ58_06420 [Gammaproteobacteria bacterium]|nr:MAG: hypothetical protein DRQ58_06420 [Gammaproteobacteria bacterium]